jgi:hypothetical protein
MAEPIILAYGRGAFPEFPGIPEGILDVIPADYVVNALLAVGSRRTEPGDRVYHHVCSGERNPLHFRKVYDYVREYFGREPLPDRGRGFVKPPVWVFPASAGSSGGSGPARRSSRSPTSGCSACPRSPNTRKLVERLDRTKGRVDFLRRYADLYGAYVEAEVIYTDDRTLDFYRSLPEQDRREFPFDAADVDWRYYLAGRPLPGDHARHAVPASAPARRPRSRSASATDMVLAAFDMEGTILSSNVIESYLWLRMADLASRTGPARSRAWPRDCRRTCRPSGATAGEFLRAFYRRYEGASVEELAPPGGRTGGRDRAPAHLAGGHPADPGTPPRGAPDRA